MADIPDYRMQPTFPIASVIDAAQRNNTLQQQAQQYGQQQLVSGLQSIGQIGQSLMQRRMAMAQALSAAKLYAGTPEGQQTLGTNQVATDANGQPVMKAQTAAGGANVSPVANTPGVDMGTLQSAFYGEPPSNLLTQLYERQKQRQEFGLQQQKQAFEEGFKPQQLAVQQQLNNALLGIRSKTLGVQESRDVNDQITKLQQEQNGLLKDLPSGVIDSYRQGILPDPKYQQSVLQHEAIQRRIEGLQNKLQGNSSSGNSPAARMSTADLIAISQRNQ